jgi:hypothetical protein
MRTRRHRTIPILVATALLAGIPLPASAARPAPSGPSTVSFAGLTWTVKEHSRKIGPGPNFFAASNVSVDSGGRLHLQISRSGKKWTAAEVIANATFGYGTYTWRLAPVPQLDPNVVLGLFTWNDDPDFAHREIDIELARWGNAAERAVRRPAMGRPGARPALDAAAGARLDDPLLHLAAWARRLHEHNGVGHPDPILVVRRRRRPGAGRRESAHEPVAVPGRGAAGRSAGRDRHRVVRPHALGWAIILGR